MKKTRNKGFIFLYPLFLSIILVFGFGGKTFAQVNIENLQKTDLEDGVHSSLSTSIGLVSGNTNARNLAAEFRTDYLEGVYHLFFVADGSRGDTDNDLHENKGFLHLRGQRSFNENFALEVFAQEEFNDFILLEERTLMGSGVRFAPFLPPQGGNYDFAFHIGVGLMWEIERYDGSGEKDKRLLRSTNYLAGKWKIQEKLLFSATSYYQVDVSRASDYRVLFDGNLGFNITGKLLFDLEINYRYDNEPLQGVENFDLELTNGITYLF